MNWVNSSPERQKKYGQVLDQLADFMKRYEIYAAKNELLSSIMSPYFGSTLLSQAYTIYRTVLERQKLIMTENLLIRTEIFPISSSVFNWLNVVIF